MGCKASISSSEYGRANMGKSYAPSSVSTCVALDTSPQSAPVSAVMRFSQVYSEL